MDGSFFILLSTLWPFVLVYFPGLVDTLLRCGSKRPIANKKENQNIGHKKTRKVLSL